MRPVVQFLLLVLGSVVSSIDQFAYDLADPEAEAHEIFKCRCVEWSWCDEDGFIITDGGDGLLSMRSLFAPTCDSCGECPSAHICCAEPPSFGGTSWDICGTNKYNDFLGYRIMDLDPLISQTKFAEFPWTLMLLRTQKQPNGEWKYVFRGGASLIHPRIALTAAHTVWRANESMITVRAGEWNASSNAEEIPHQNSGVQKIIIHPSFDNIFMYNDIALLILNQPFELADNVRPICLPSPNIKYDENSCLAVGWGTNRFGPEGRYSTTLRKVHLPIVADKECQRKLRTTYLGKRFLLHNSFMCAGGLKDRDTCLGDGGGPLMCRTDGGVYVQIGIVSWGVKCGTEMPAVYTNLLMFLNWINPIIANVSVS